MAVQTFTLSESTAARRRFYVFCVDATDGITPETGESGGQPQISVNGAAFASTEETLSAVANGLYYVELSVTELSALGKIVVRYKSANTAEFQDVAYIQSTGEVSNDELKTLLVQLSQKINFIEHLLQKGEVSAIQQQELSIT